MKNATKKASKNSPAAEICLYGNRNTGAGWIARTSTGKTLGHGETSVDRTFTHAIYLALETLWSLGETASHVAIFDAGGERWAFLPRSSVPSYGSIKWRAAPVYTLDAASLKAAAE